MGDAFHTVFAEEYGPVAYERMRSVGTVTILTSHDESSLKEAVKECDALLVRSYARITGEVIQGADRLRVIGRGGVGVDNIDLAAARAKGIVVVHTPEAGTEAVADLTVGLMISLIRRIGDGDRLVREGHFKVGRSQCTGRDLCEFTLGVVGLGRIGKAVARRCHQGFGMTVLFNDIVEPGPLDFDAVPVSKHKLFQTADVISLHVPITAQTQNLVNDATLQAFKPESYLINTARGAVVDSVSLAKSLTAGQLAGAALDVTEPEPLPTGHPLLSAPNTLLTPHIAARTTSSLHRMNLVVEDVIRVLAGREPRWAAAEV